MFIIFKQIFIAYNSQIFGLFGPYLILLINKYYKNKTYKVNNLKKVF